jgi:hypothetical protein
MPVLEHGIQVSLEIISQKLRIKKYPASFDLAFFNYYICHNNSPVS